MAREYQVGYMKQPTRLAGVLKTKGFLFVRTVEEPTQEGIRAVHYFDFNHSKKTKNKVRIQHHEPCTIDNRFDRELAALSIISLNKQSNEFDREKQKDIAYFLQKHYDGLLFDPNKGIIKRTA